MIKKSLRFSVLLPWFCKSMLAAAEHSRPASAPVEFHMLAPGFEVKELPLTLTNLVNLQYRHDGVLVALGYNGNIHLLRDTDGDGLEDKAELFWEGKGKVTAPIGMDLATKGYQHGDAVFFACKGKVMMVSDADGDGKAEMERVIAEGWPLAFAGIDTASVCFDPRDGSVLFGLGVRLYNNAYEFDAFGKAQNDLKSERGAILRIAPDFLSREKLCTGVRWPIGLRFNHHGDLFCTDQEGATWLPNGNPFDELLLIEKGRHYGFPPRHPKHLPNVVDEPSVFDYGPQHQSTCGFRFNEGVNGGPHFGPDAWNGDALVTGESRGKIYRTKLVKTTEGYVAQNHILACMNQLAVDLTISPRGDMLVATHSGNPDWGSGPEGIGKVFRVVHKEKSALQPVASYALDAETMEVAFDKPLPAEARAERLTHGRYTQPGDRFETMWPGYEVIKLQRSLPVKAIPVMSTATASKLTVKTPPQSSNEPYALQMGTLGEVGLSLAGVEMRIAGEASAQWLPHLSTQVCHGLLGPLMPTFPLGKEITLTTRLDLWGMLQPAIQPGAALDYEPEAEEVTLWISSPTTAFTLLVGGKKMASQQGQVSHDVLYTHIPSRHTPVDIQLKFTAASAPDLRIGYRTKWDMTRDRALQLHRFYLPWAKPEAAANVAAALPRKEIQGANWKHGREVFLSDKALCSKCHAVRGVGSKLGPDLSNLTSRDYASVRRDINDPHASLNPEYLTHEVTLKDGRKLAAVLRDDADGAVVLGLGAGAEIRVASEDIVAKKALNFSLMIPKIDEQLGESDFRDLMAFLLTEPPVMREYSKQEAAPPHREKHELAALLAGAPPQAGNSETMRPLSIVLVSGKKDHGTGEHDYPRWSQTWSRLFSLAAKTTVTLAIDWPTAEQWQTADAIVFYRKGDWSTEKAAEMDTFLKRGGGATFIHWAVEAGDKAADLASRIGLASNATLTKYRHGTVDLVFNTAMNHPIARGFDKVTFTDEIYWNLVPANNVNTAPIATSEGHPQAWTQEPKTGGRIFVTLGGHYSWTFDDPLFRALVLRGIAWTTKESVDRFNNLLEAGLE